VLAPGIRTLLDLCQNDADVTPTRRHRPVVVVHTTGASAGVSAQVDGIPIAPGTLESVRGEARVVEQRDDAPVIDYGTERLVGDPDQPDGLHLIHVDADARAGPAP
jgi:hypothetical protein